MIAQRRRTWAEINLDNLRHNVQVINKFKNPNALLMGVVKADAYGHGAICVAEELLRCGVHRLAVSMVDEAIELRNAGISAPVLVLSDNALQYSDKIAEYDITPAVFSIETGKRLSEAAVKQGKKVKIHIKIDTGMGRIGFLPDEAPDAAEILSKLPGLEIEGIFTHLAVADEYSEEAQAYTEAQYAIFCSVCERITNEKHINIPIKHIANSAAVLRYPHMHMDMVRAGIILYGLWPSEEVKETGADLKAVMTVKSAVSHVKDVECNTCLSYGCTYRTAHKMQVATIPIGYADGYMRIQSNKGFVFHEASGQRLQIAGRICMDQMMVDASPAFERGGVSDGDVVIIFGDYDRPNGRFPTAEGIGRLAGTINYEVCCAISRRVPRVFIKQGKPVKELNRLIDL